MKFCDENWRRSVGKTFSHFLIRTLELILALSSPEHSNSLIFPSFASVRGSTRVENSNFSPARRGETMFEKRRRRGRSRDKKKTRNSCHLIDIRSTFCCLQGKPKGIWVKVKIHFRHLLSISFTFAVKKFQTLKLTTDSEELLSSIVCLFAPLPRLFVNLENTKKFSSVFEETFVQIFCFLKAFLKFSRFSGWN